MYYTPAQQNTIDYMRENKTPTLDEIQTNVFGLNYRSSALRTVRRLISLGVVMAVGRPRTKRRYTLAKEIHEREGHTPRGI